jgi:hypothetical protein
MVMRSFLVFCLLASVIFSAPAWANPGRNLGSTACTREVMCPSRDMDTSGYVAQAVSCASRNFGFNADVFDLETGLDYNNCIATKGSQTFGSSTVAVAPHCCYYQNDSGNCQLRCDVLTVQ